VKTKGVYIVDDASHAIQLKVERRGSLALPFNIIFGHVTKYDWLAGKQCADESQVLVQTSYSVCTKVLG